jgi:hypothetical protein
MMGTKKYERAVLAVTKVLESSKCHTIDRDHMIAQKDETCGIGTGNDQWRYAVQ